MFLSCIPYPASRIIRILGTALFLTGAWVNHAPADTPELNGYLKNLVAVSDARENYKTAGLTDNDFQVDNYSAARLKLKIEPTKNLELITHYEVRMVYGQSIRIEQALADTPAAEAVTPAGLLPSTEQRFFDLEHTSFGGTYVRAGHGLDRLYARYQTDRHAWSLGRQPVNWGSGLIWTPSDLFAGFSPTEIDRDEKPGVDVVRWIWNATPDTALDLVAQPLDTGHPYSLDRDDSSLAVRLTSHWGEYDVAATGGYIAGDRVIGGDLSGYLGDAGLRGELLYTHVDEDDQRNYIHGLISYDYSFQARWDPYVLMEYFYNGLGTGDEDNYLKRLSATSVQRAFSRSNAFNIGRHYVGSTLGLTLSALVTLNATTLFNIEDQSLRELAVINWSLLDDLEFQLGTNFGMGGSGSEFEGFRDPQTGQVFENPDFVFAFLKAYF